MFFPLRKVKKNRTQILIRFAHCLSVACVILASLLPVAYSQETSTNDWHPNTRLLDLAAKQHDPSTENVGSTLARDVKRFYELLRDKKWHQTYQLRAKAFREEMPETDYLAEALKYENRWGLVDYEVLSIKLQNSVDSTNMDQAVLICKFSELLHHEASYSPVYWDKAGEVKLTERLPKEPFVSYSTVYWHKEEGVWKCLSAGPSKLSIFNGLRPPIVDWR